MTDQEQQDSQDTRMQEKEISFAEFKEFFNEFPESTNDDLYDAFPTKSKGTIRGWKTRVKKEIESSAQTQTPQDNSQQDFIIKGLCNDLGVDFNALKVMGLSYNAALNYLQQKAIDRELSKNKKTKAGGILPTPLSYGEGSTDYGIVEYIMKFDGINEKVEIEIPFDVLFDPEQNKNLGKKVELSRDAQKRKQKFRFA